MRTDEIIRELEKLWRPFVITDDDLTHNRAICEAIDIVKKHSSDGWIPVSERLPNEEEYQKHDGRFILSDGNRTYQGWFSPYEGYFVREGWSLGMGIHMCEDKCVTAWQPLPDKYKEVKANETD